MRQDADAASSGIVVADAGPLIALARVEQLSLLAVLYGQIVVPESVLRELRLESHRPGARLLSDGFARGLLRTHPLPADSEADLARLRQVLDAGESAAILLAQALACRFLLIDERRGRVMARRRGIPVVGRGRRPAGGETPRAVGDGQTRPIGLIAPGLPALGCPDHRGLATGG